MFAHVKALPFKAGMCPLGWPVLFISLNIYFIILFNFFFVYFCVCCQQIYLMYFFLRINQERRWILGIEQFRFEAESIDEVLAHAKDGIDFSEAILAQQRESCQAEQRVEWIHLVAGPVCEAAVLGVLRNEHRKYYYYYLRMKKKKRV